MTRVLLLIVALFGWLRAVQRCARGLCSSSAPQTIKPNPMSNTMLDFPSNMSRGGSCLPSLKDLQVPTDVFNANPDAEISKRIQVIVDADQAAREGTITSEIAARGCETPGSTTAIDSSSSHNPRFL